MLNQRLLCLFGRNIFNEDLFGMHDLYLAIAERRWLEFIANQESYLFE